MDTENPIDPSISPLLQRPKSPGLPPVLAHELLINAGYRLFTERKKHFPFILHAYPFTPSLIGRFSKFVITPEIPKILIREQKWLKPAHYDALEMAKSTILKLIAEKSSGRVCPHALFLCTQPFSDERYLPHQLQTYIPNMAAEKQFSFEFHIVGHANPDQIGAIPWGEALIIEDFAEKIVVMLNTHDPEGSVKFKTRSLHFIFHCCTSAYCNINESMSIKDIEQCLINESLIGKFFRKLQENGYHNVSVSGFRGYYLTSKNHKNAFVASSPAAVSTLPAEKTKFTIHARGTVTLPNNSSGCFLPVPFLDAYTKSTAVETCLSPGF